MSFFYRLKEGALLKIKSRSLQNIAQEYWSNCENSFIGAEELYINQERVILEEFVPKLEVSDTVLDIGCCDGRFTFLISEHCGFVDAFDLSENLIKKAISTAKSNRIKNVHFWSENIQDLSESKRYNHLICMGVFTAIPDEKIVFNAIKTVSKKVKQGGYILLKDSLAEDYCSYYNNENYAAIYRKESDYKDLFLNFGMSVEAEYNLYSVIMKDQKVSSKMILMKKN